MKRIPILLFLCFSGSQISIAQSPLSTSKRYAVRTDGADWHLKGEGVVCCPCAVPCPCRTNGGASYGHCEASLYLHIREGHYGTVSLSNLKLVNTSGACAMSYQKLAALYFDRSVGVEQQTAFMKLMASFFQDGAAEFPYVRAVSIDVKVTDGHLFYVSIPEILEMAVDRNWGQAAPPFPTTAATDHFSNALQYAQNLRYRMHDDDAKLDFNYSRRQANYRAVDLDAAQYRSKSMLIQFSDGKGQFNADQLRLIREQHLTLPDLDAIKQLVARLK